MDFRYLHMLSEMPLESLSAFFNIPQDRLDAWDTGTEECPDYLLELMRYKLEHEGIIPMRPKPIKTNNSVFIID